MGPYIGRIVVFLFYLCGLIFCAVLSFTRDGNNVECWIFVILSAVALGFFGASIREYFEHRNWSKGALWTVKRHLGQQ